MTNTQVYKYLSITAFAAALMLAGLTILGWNYLVRFRSFYWGETLMTTIGEKDK